ncbi:hypothetical protein BBJ28_00006114 [Nothophytophthora sp. Chile5]|nr:hypothetical protein BBJ28_00006114 [Nothophytophthora sp. Chile5]
MDERRPSSLEGGGKRPVEPQTQSDTGSRRGSSNQFVESKEIERLREELHLEITPQKLLRQYTLSVPPFSAGESSGGDAADGFAARNGLLDAAPNVLEGILKRWEKNQVRWRQFGSSDSLDASAPPSSDELEASNSPMEPLPTEMDASAAAVALTSGEDLFTDVATDLPSVPRSGTFDVQFGDGFLGLEFVFDKTKNKVVIKNVHRESRAAANVLYIPPGMTITRGLSVEAVNGHEVRTMPPEEILDSLQFSKRPMTVRFRRAAKAVVVCKLCETKVDTSRLDEHTNYCVLSKRVELEADVINNSLAKLTASITTNLAAQSMRPMFNQEETHIYHALRVVAIQASTCDVTCFESFALCSRLVKIIDRIRQQEAETSNFAVERGAKYCTKLRNLIHAKMSKMRASHKVMFQQNPSETSATRATFKRTKSLEELENSSSFRTARRPSNTRSASYRVSIRDFQIVKPISKGAFGKVYLARKKTTGDQYAIKVLAKEHLLRKKQVRPLASA